MWRRVCLLVLLVSLPAFCQGKWLRRATLAASCAASFWDAATTASAVSAGAVERNPLLANANGKPRWGLLLGLKTGLCAGMAVAQEKHVFGRRMDPAWIGLNTGITSFYTVTSLHNRRVAAELKPAYLLKP